MSSYRYVAVISLTDFSIFNNSLLRCPVSRVGGQLEEESSNQVRNTISTIFVGGGAQFQFKVSNTTTTNKTILNTLSVIVILSEIKDSKARVTISGLSARNIYHGDAISS